MRRLDESPYRSPAKREAFIPSTGIDYVPLGIGISPSKKVRIEQGIEDEKLRIRETKANLAKELENETNRRL